MISRANRIVAALLEDAPVRACLDCEREHGILDRQDATKTHGHCKRHFITTHRALGYPEEAIQQGVATAEAEGGWCPDLGPVSTRDAAEERLRQARLNQPKITSEFARLQRERLRQQVEQQRKHAG